MQAEPESELHAVFHGQVQGVGFRYRTQQCMSGIDVNGYVRNLPDGGVELLLQGQPDLLEAALTRVRARMGEFIRNVEVQRRDVQKPIRPGFEIRR
jgi:acylphosphatase